MTDVLAALLGGDTDRFADEMWDRRAVVRRGVPDAVWKDLLSTQELDDLMASRRSDIHLLANGRWVDRTRYVRPVAPAPMLLRTEVIDPGEVFRLFASGATIVLHGLHEWWPRLDRLCSELTRSFSMAVQANAYVAPPGRAGHRHHDLHHVIVLQLHGTKHWTIEQRKDIGPDGREPAELLEVDLGPGDCLYVPRRFAHWVETTTAYSTHITFGIMAPTWGDVVRAISTTSLERELEETPLPPGFACGGGPALRAQATATLARIRDAWAIGADELAAQAAERFAATAPTTWEGHYGALLSTMNLDDGACLEVRGAGPDVRVEGEAVVVSCGAHRLEMPAFVAPAIEHMVERRQFRLGELQQFLDGQSAVVLARRLVQEGVLTIHGSSIRPCSSAVWSRPRAR